MWDNITLFQISYTDFDEINLSKNDSVNKYKFEI